MHPDHVEFTPSRGTRMIGRTVHALVPFVCAGVVTGAFMLHPGAGVIALGLLFREASIILTQFHARRLRVEYDAHATQISEQYIRAQAEAKAQHDERVAQGGHYGSMPTPSTRNPFVSR